MNDTDVLRKKKKTEETKAHYCKNKPNMQSQAASFKYWFSSLAPKTTRARPCCSRVGELAPICSLPPCSTRRNLIKRNEGKEPSKSEQHIIYLVLHEKASMCIWLNRSSWECYKLIMILCAHITVKELTFCSSLSASSRLLNAGIEPPSMTPSKFFIRTRIWKSCAITWLTWNSRSPCEPVFHFHPHARLSLWCVWPQLR